MLNSHRHTEEDDDFSYNFRGWTPLFFRMLLVDNFFELGIVPIGHRIVFAVTHVHVNGTLLHLVLQREIVRELTLVALGAGALLEERTHNRLGISALLDLLRLHWLEDHGHLTLIGQFLLLLLLAFVAILSRVMPTGLHLFLYLLNELLLLRAFLVFQTKGFVLPIE